MKKHFYLIVLLICSLSAAAQNGTLQGKIVDENGLPMPGATVQITNLSQVGSFTDGEGRFTIYNVPTGNHTLKITYIGYQESEQEIEVSGGINDVDFSLTPGVTLGDEVIVLGDRLKGQAKAVNRQKNNVCDVLIVFLSVHCFR